MTNSLFRHFARVTSVCLLVAALSFATSLRAAEKTSDADAIRAAIDSYVAAYNRGDAKAVAAHWSETGEWTNPAGEKVHGRQAIEKELQAMFAASKGVSIAVTAPSIRIVSADVAVEEGTATITRPGEDPEESTYVAIHVKKTGKWTLDSVYETDVAEEAPASSPLQELAWLVGQWIDESEDSTVEATVTWTKNKTFLNYAFKMSVPGMDDLEGTQVIGWDPAAETIRSWMFDSDGGIGQGVWSKKGDHWVVTFDQVLPDGRRASATNIYALADGNTCTWTSIGRKLDGQFLPNIDDVKMVRKTSAATVNK